MKKIDYKIINPILLAILAASVIFIIPQWKRPRDLLSTYEEVHLESALASMDKFHQSMMDSQQTLPDFNRDSSIKWNTPVGWIEEKGSGMRVVTFKNKTNPQEIECSIVSLGKEAGGLKENLIRWAGQVNIELSDAQLQEFGQKKEIWKTKDGQPVQMFDFSQLQKADDETPSMMAAIIQTSQATVFVKMTGSKAAISRNKESFKGLNESLTHIE